MKRIIPLLVSLLCASAAHADWRFNPYTQRQDYFEATSDLKLSTASLRNDLNAEISRAIGAEGALAGDIATEISDRAAGDAALAAKDASIILSTGALDLAKVNRSGDTMTGTLKAPEVIFSSPVVNVKYFGAVGDGATDDTSAIEAAIASLGTGGGTVFFPGGTYKLSHEVRVYDRDGIALVGAGRLATKIWAHDFNGQHFQFDDCNSITVKDMTLYGDGINAAKSTGGIAFGRVNNDNTGHNNFENLLIEDITNSGIGMSVPILTTFKNVKVRYFAGHGFSLSGGTSVNMESCYAITGTQAGFYFKDFTYSNINASVAEVVGVGFLFDNSKAISLNGCGTEAILNRSVDYPGYAYWVKGREITCVSCYATGSATQHIKENANSYFDRINFKDMTTGDVTTQIHGLRVEPSGAVTVNKSSFSVMGSSIMVNNGSIENPNYIQFNTLFADGQSEGRLQWNIEEGTLEFGLPGGNVNLQIGEELLFRAKMFGGAGLNGQVVAITGASGGRPKIELADADNSALNNCTIGVLTEDINENNSGYFNAFGYVHDVNLSAFAEGDVVYLGTTPGSLTKTIPAPPARVVKVGRVITNNANGTLFVKVTDTPPQIVVDSMTATDAYATNMTATKYYGDGSSLTKISSYTVASVPFDAWAAVCSDEEVPMYKDGYWQCGVAGGGGGGGGKEYYFSNDASDISPYKVMYSSYQAQAETELTATNNGGTVMVATFTTLSGYPITRTLPDFQWDTYLHARRISGTRSIRLYASVYARATGGTERLIGTTEVSPILTATEADYHLHFTTGVVMLASGERIVTKVYAENVSGATATSIGIKIQGSIGSHQMVPSQPLDPNDFVAKSTAFSGDVTGTYNATVVGDDSHSHSASTLSGVIQSTATGTYGLSITGNAATATTATTAATATTATNFSGSLSGDVTGTQGATVVGDNSHLHSASTLQNVVSTGTAFSGDVTGAYNATVVGDNSHLHNATSLSGVMLSTGATMTGPLTLNTSSITINSAEMLIKRYNGLFTGLSLQNAAGYVSTPEWSPYVNFTNNAKNWAIGGLFDDWRVVNVTNSVEALKVGPTGDVTAAGTFYGGGAGLTSLTAANISAGTAGINISGNAATATSATTANNFSGSLSGDVTGGQSSTVVGDDSHAHTGTTISGLAVADFSSPNISNWTNDSGFITSAGTAANFSGSLAGDVTGTQGATVVGNDSHSHTSATLPAFVSLDSTQTFTGENTFADAMITRPILSSIPLLDTNWIGSGSYNNTMLSSPSEMRIVAGSDAIISLNSYYQNAWGRLGTGPASAIVMNTSGMYYMNAISGTAGAPLDMVTRLTVDSDGIGVNLTDPTVALDVSGSGNLTGNLDIDGNTFAVGGSTLAVSQGKVAVNSSVGNNAAPFTVYTTRNGNATQASDADPIYSTAHLQYATSTNGVGPALSFGTSSAKGSTGAKIGFIRTGSSSTGDMVLYTRSSTAVGFDQTAERMRIKDSGKIGIGTSAPGTLLHVSSGALTMDGTGADIITPQITLGGVARTSWPATGTGDVVLAATQTFTGGNTFTNPVTGYMKGTYALIATTTTAVSVTALSVPAGTFTSSSTYRVEFNLQKTGTADIIFTRLNGDTGSNYAWAFNAFAVTGAGGAALNSDSSWHTNYAIINGGNLKGSMDIDYEYGAPIYQRMTFMTSSHNSSNNMVNVTGAGYYTGGGTTALSYITFQALTGTLKGTIRVFKLIE